ncbi:MAG: manganese-dependent inorganic pyrophosphatase [Candidatus Altiarchaeales archaeon ex4484_96]|nr:MAG: manganese-dependent inorganic pyrophosphatase [Candidatus Altiarchaeales archaeon ex4484_96]
MSEKIYVIGHMNPDTDSICSALAYAEFKNQVDPGNEYIAARMGEMNSETAYVLERFGFSEPVLLEDATGLNIILVDHNEKSQSVEGYDGAQILEVIDHHKINFKCSEPIYYLNEPVGSTATILGDMFLSTAKNIDEGIAGLLLSAILSDTVVFKSATTTEKDWRVAKKMAQLAKINDIKAFGIEVKKAKSSLEGLSANQIIYSDFKDFDFKNSKVGIGQIEVVDSAESEMRRDELLDELNDIRESKDYDLLVLMVTNIMDEGSELLVSGLSNKIEAAFDVEVKDNRVYLDGVMSRKKQIVPLIEGVF